MAILKLGVLVTGIRGTVGGTIFSANKAGPFARSWSKGADPHTENQTTVRARLSSHGAKWQDLAQGDRDDWDTYAAAAPQELTNSLGEAYYVTGFNWYCTINNHLLIAGDARRDTYPTNARPAAPTINDFTVKIPINQNSRVGVSYPTNEFNVYRIICFLGFAPSPALLWKSRGYRLVCTRVQQYLMLTQFGDDVAPVFADPPLGAKAFATFQRQEAHGQRSAPTTITEIVFE